MKSLASIKNKNNFSPSMCTKSNDILFEIRYTSYFSTLSMITIKSARNIESYSWYWGVYHNMYMSHKLNMKTLKTDRVYIEGSGTLINRLQNQCVIKGHKRTAHKVYTKYVNIFYNKFRSYDADLHNMYPMYKIYYDFSKKNPEVFFNINTVYNAIISKLLPTFIFSTSSKKRKKKKEIIKTTSISYVQPKNRVSLAIRLIKLYSGTFNFSKTEFNKSYALLLLLLTGNNSELSKKKIQAYKRLMTQKKLKI